jgi:hypothetical protein
LSGQAHYCDYRFLQRLPGEDEGLCYNDAFSWRHLSSLLQVGWRHLGAMPANVVETIKTHEQLEPFPSVGVTAGRGTHKRDYRSRANSPKRSDMRFATNQHSRGAVQIYDAFWPYVMPAPAENAESANEYIERIRTLLGIRRCVRFTFAPADEKLAPVSLF